MINIRFPDGAVRQFESGISALQIAKNISEGLAKKVLVANQLAPLVDIVFESNISELGTQEAWFGILAFSFQLYFDFSGEVLSYIWIIQQRWIKIRSS